MQFILLCLDLCLDWEQGWAWFPSSRGSWQSNELSENGSDWHLLADCAVESFISINCVCNPISEGTYLTAWLHCYLLGESFDCACERNNEQWNVPQVLQNNSCQCQCITTCLEWLCSHFLSVKAKQVVKLTKATKWLAGVFVGPLHKACASPKLQNDWQDCPLGHYTRHTPHL